MKREKEKAGRRREIDVEVGVLGEGNSNSGSNSISNSAVTFRHWCPIKAIDRSFNNLQDTQVHGSAKKNESNHGPSKITGDLDWISDMNELTWLTQVTFIT